MLADITPIVLTYNEAPNIARTLAQLSWAREVLVVDSFSDDGTLDIVQGFSNTRVLQRAFDDFASQWNHALDHGAIPTPWVLSLDADYVLTPELVQEITALQPTATTAGYRVRFRYCVDGRPLRGSLYPPSTVLVRPDRARYRLDGHAYRVDPGPGEVVELQGFVQHDDRKPMGRWLESQRRYAKQEAEKLRGTSLTELSWPDRIRRVPFLASPLAFAYCMAAKGCALDGRAGLKYAAQRAGAELVISLALLKEGRRQPLA